MIIITDNTVDTFADKVAISFILREKWRKNENEEKMNREKIQKKEEMKKEKKIKQKEIKKVQ